MKNIYLPKAKVIVLLLFIGLSSFKSFAQVGIGNTDPHASSLLDIRTDDNDKGILIPRVDISNLGTAAPVTGPVASLLVYNTNTTTGPGFFYWNGTRWVGIDNEKDWKLKGNTGTTAGNDFLGTTDNVALQFKTRNFSRFEITSGTSQTTGGRLRAFTNGTAAEPIYSWNTNSGTGMFQQSGNAIGFSTNGTERFRIPNSDQVFAVANGSAALPFYSWNSDTDIGLFRATTNQLGLSTAGVERMRINNNGAVGIGTTTPSTSALDGVNVQRVNVVGSQTTNGASVSEVINSGKGISLLVANTSNANNYSTFESSAIGSGVAVKGLHKPGQAAGYLGFGVGVEGSTNSYDGYGVLGSSPAWGFWGDNGAAGYFVGDVVVTGDIYNPSDIRLKENINVYNGALEKLNSLKTYTYNFNDEIYQSDNITHIGFIAQEIEKIFPNLVEEKRLLKNNTNSNRMKPSEMNSSIYKTVNYLGLIPVLTEAINEQQKIIDSQEARITKLESMIKQLINKH